MNPLDRFAEGVTQDDAGKYDVAAVEPRDVQYLSTGQIQIGKKGDILEPTHWAIKQLCQKLGIPFRFWIRLSEDIKADVINYLLYRHERAFLLRCRPGMIRAFLSEEAYTIYNNADVMGVLKTAFESCPVKLCYPHLDDQGVWIRVVVEGMERNGMEGGVVVGNSEVGARSLSAASFLLVLVCSNGLISARTDNEFKLPHRHLRTTEMGARLVEHIGLLLNHNIEVIERMIDAHSEPVPNLGMLIDRLTKEYQGSKAFADEWKISSLATAHLEDRTPMVADLVNGLTATARGYSGDTRTEWERRAGDLLFNLNPIPAQLVPSPMFVEA